jgi:hypothetical protein
MNDDKPNRKFTENCYICESPLPKFITTPILELPDGSLEQCCKSCANKEFPGYDDDNDENDS